MIRLLAPRYWGAHLLALVLVLAAVALGLWQLDAWHERRASASRDLTGAAPVALSSVMGGDSAFPGQDVGKPVTFAGHWLPQGTVYVADRRHDGRDGYWVVTPLAVDGTRSAMPVVRGWSARPQAPEASGTARVTGWLQPAEGTGLPDEDTADDVVPELRTATLVQHVDADLYGGYVISRSTTGTATAGLAAVHPAQAPEVGQTTALRNFLYALEWWIFGLFAVVVWVRWCRDTLAPRPAEEEPDRPRVPSSA